MQPRGGKAKYEKAKRIDIARRYLETDLSLREVGAIYNLSISTVSAYVKEYRNDQRERAEAD